MVGDQGKGGKEILNFYVDPELTTFFQGMMALCTRIMFNVLFPEKEEESEEEA